MPPAAWQYAATADGMINSNYGYLNMVKDNGYQYDNVLRRIKR